MKLHQIGKLASLIGSLCSTAQAILPAHLHNTELAPFFSSLSTGSPLQQLVDSVTYLGTEKKKRMEDCHHTEKATSLKAKEEQTNETKNEIIKMMTTSEEIAFPLHNIPVISSTALKSLPPNIKAIPLGVNANRLLEQQSSLPNNTNNVVSKNEQNPPTTPVNEQPSPPVINPSPKQESSINIPLELFDQIVNGEVSIRTLLANANNNTNGGEAGSSHNNLVAIDTKMGTIPIIPVKGCGGLQLIPIQQQQRQKQQEGDGEVQQPSGFPPRSTPAATMMVSDAPSGPYPFPMLHSPLSLIPPVPHSSSSAQTPSLHFNENLLPSKSISQPGLFHIKFFYVHEVGRSQCCFFLFFFLLLFVFY